MHKIRIDLQKRIDESMEESKGYKMDDSEFLFSLAKIPSSNQNSVSNSSSSSIDNHSLHSFNNALDRESLREEKRLNKIAKEAKKFLSSPLA